MDMDRMFLLEKGRFVVIRADEKEVGFSSLDEFAFYCADICSVDLSDKWYVDYEPHRGVHIDPSTFRAHLDIPNQAYETLIDNVDIILARKADPYWGKTAAEAVAIKRGEITRFREDLLASGYTHTDGHIYDSDPKARERLLALVLALALGQPLEEGFSWMSQENILIPHTRESILAVFLGMMAWEQTILYKSWDMKDDLDGFLNEKRTVEDIKTYDHEAEFRRLSVAKK